MGRTPCYDKSNVKKGPWTPEEDAKILAHVANHGIGNWTLVPEKAGLNRCGKSCRLRWTNYLRPDLKHDNFTPQEEEHILKLHKAIGSRWSMIAKQLPGRTDNDVKNHWNTKLRKKLLKMDIDPVTHKPFSQILADYGNITGLPNTRNHIESLDNFLTNRSMLKTEPSLVTTEFTTPPFMLNGPLIEQFQDNPLSSKHAWDNASHFQDNILPHFFNEVSSSTSTSSSCNLTQLTSPQSVSCRASQLQTVQLSPSSWSDYLPGGPSLLTNIEQKQEREFQVVELSSYPSVSIQTEAPGYNCSEATSSAADSFVDTILNRDSELQSEFPEIFLDGYLNN